MTVPEDLFEVGLIGMPLLLRERSRQHGADLLREMALLGTPDPGTQGQGQGQGQDTDQDSHDGARPHLPTRLLELAHELDTYYAPYIASSTEQMEQALDDGKASLDVTYRVPANSVPFVQHVAQILAEVEQYCRTDRYLLTRAPPDDIAAYRTWSISEVTAGLPPTPWATYLAATRPA